MTEFGKLGKLPAQLEFWKDHVLERPWNLHHFGSKSLIRDSFMDVYVKVNHQSHITSLVCH